VTNGTVFGLERIHDPPHIIEVKLENAVCQGPSGGDEEGITAENGVVHTQAEIASWHLN
jgi:hypothetical protein